MMVSVDIEFTVETCTFKLYALTSTCFLLDSLQCINTGKNTICMAYYGWACTRLKLGVELTLYLNKIIWQNNNYQ